MKSEWFNPLSAKKVVFESNKLLGLHLCVGKVHVLPVYKNIYILFLTIINFLNIAMKYWTFSRIGGGKNFQRIFHGK